MNHLRVDFGFGVERDKDGAVISRDLAMQALAEIRQEAMKIFGAYTLLPTNGGWTNPKGETVEEVGFTLFVIQPISPESDSRQRDKTEQFATFIKHSLNQEAIAVSSYPVNFSLL